MLNFKMRVVGKIQIFTNYLNTNNHYNYSECSLNLVERVRAFAQVQGDPLLCNEMP